MNRYRQIHFTDTDELPHRYGLEELPADISHQELLYFCSLKPDERQFINGQIRTYSNRVVVGIHLAAFKFIGRSQLYPEKTPETTIAFIAKELGIEDSLIPLSYSDREKTRSKHVRLAREFLGLSSFGPKNHQQLIDYLFLKSPDPGNILDWIRYAEDYLRENRFALPSIKSLRRIILSTRSQAMENVTLTINNQLTPEIKVKFCDAFNYKANKAAFWNDVIDKNKYSATPSNILKIIDQIATIRSLSLNSLDLKKIPDSHLDNLAQQGLQLNALRLKTYKLEHQYAIMLATFIELEAEFIDVIIQMNDEIIASMLQRAQNKSDKFLKKYRRIVTQVITAFRLMCDIHLNTGLRSHEKIHEIDKRITPDRLDSLRRETDAIDIPRGSEQLYFASQGYQIVEKYLPKFLQILNLISYSKEDYVLDAANYYLDRRLSAKKGIGQDAPVKFVQEARWKRIVFDQNDRIKPKAWVFCLSDKIRTSFRQGSIEAEGARQYKSLNSDLIAWPEWRSIELVKNKTLPFTDSSDDVFKTVSFAIKDLSYKFRQWEEQEVPPARIDTKHRLHLTKLDKEDVPESAVALKEIIKKECQGPRFPKSLQG